MNDKRKKFTVFQGKNGKWYWNLKNEYGVIYAHGGNLDRQQTAVDACKAVQENAPLAVILIEEKD